MGLGPVPAAAAAAPGGVETRRGGGGRGGFIVWYKKERGTKKEKNVYLHLLWKVGRKRNQKSMGKDFNGIQTEQNHKLPKMKASLKQNKQTNIAPSHKTPVVFSFKILKPCNFFQQTGK